MIGIGILAYGSLISNPGCEIEKLTDYIKRGVVTSFKVEFARRSSTRGDAPTLVPVRKGGGYVKAVVYVLREGTTLEQATDTLYRREIHEVCSDKVYVPGPVTRNKIRIKQLRNRFGVDVVLYTAISPTIRDRKPQTLAKLAVKSAESDAGRRGEDGIVYLIEAKQTGTVTPLLPEYENCICRLLAAESLEEAHKKARLKSRGQ